MVHLVRPPGLRLREALEIREIHLGRDRLEGYLRDQHHAPRAGRAHRRATRRRGGGRCLSIFIREARGVATQPLPAVAGVVVATKLDKLPLNKRKPAIDAFKRASGIPPLAFSAVTGEGRDDLWKRIRAAIA